MERLIQGSSRNDRGSAGGKGGGEGGREKGFGEELERVVVDDIDEEEGKVYIDIQPAYTFIQPAYAYIQPAYTCIHKINAYIHRSICIHTRVVFMIRLPVLMLLLLLLLLMMMIDEWGASRSNDGSFM